MLAARLLLPDDRPRVAAFLAAHAPVTMFMRSNLAASGLIDGTEPFQGVWAGAFATGDDDRLVGVATLFWNGTLIVAAPAGLVEAALVAVAATARRLVRLIGPWDQIVQARRELGMDDRPTRLMTRDVLFTLALDALVVPASNGRTVRRAVEADRPLLVGWRHAYGIETLSGSPEDDDVAARGEIDAMLARRRIWVVCEDDVPVAMTMFNAQTEDSVQVGGVFTPAEGRGRGLGRLAVAGSLLDARAAGAGTAVLFTGEDNVAAQKAYRALGFTAVGDYGMIFFAD